MDKYSINRYLGGAVFTDYSDVCPALRLSAEKKRRVVDGDSVNNIWVPRVHFFNIPVYLELSRNSEDKFNRLPTSY